MKVKIATAQTHDSAHLEMKGKEKEKHKEENIALSPRLSLHAGAALRSSLTCGQICL